MRTKHKVISFVALLILATSAQSQSLDENIDQLAERIHLSKIDAGLRKGDRNVLSVLPAKGYKNGLAGLMKKYDVYPNPEYSFAMCPAYLENGKEVCVISIKLATKTAGGQYQDHGFRIDYAIAPGSKQFAAGDSHYAKHLIAGDGFVEYELSHPDCVSLGDAMKCGIR